ncbi:hypothetical protein K438DRAFT_1731517 [Mycena galopus ATCC 62051]|nr:hypothetical protein K438DRAFT_1731517 [Mycena galopus ATCC 62051]
MSSTISDSELADLPALRKRFYALEEAQMKAMAASLFRPEVLREFKSQGTDEVAHLRLLLEMKVLLDVQTTAQASETERARRAPRVPKLDTKESLRDYLHDMSESIGIGAELPPSSVELTSKIIDKQIQFYEDEIMAMRTDENYLWHKLFDTFSHGPGTALFSYFVTMDKGPSPAKRMSEFPYFYGRAFRAEVYHAYHFLSVWTWVKKAFEELKGLGYTMKSAERDILKNPKIHTLILQIKGVCLTELCQDLSNYLRRALASSARYGRYFNIEWDECTVKNQGRYLEDVKVTVKPNALQEALPGLEKSLLHLCNPEAIWESPDHFRIIDHYIRCPTVPKPYITARIGEILSEYATITIFMDFLLRPFKAPSIQEMYRKSPISPPSVPRRPGWDTSWTGMVYGGDPIYALTLVPHMSKKFLKPGVTEQNWLPTLWKAIDDTYLANTSKTINDYWEVKAVGERPPQWHGKRDETGGSTYVPPSVALSSERVQSAYSYLTSIISLQSHVKQKSRPSMPGEYEPPEVDVPPMENLHLHDPPSQHPVYELPRKTVKIIHRLLRHKVEGAQVEPEGKVTWKDVCKIFRALDFTIDDSTPGSAVNFIPPSPQDRSITIHRPHPDPELSPLRIRQLGSRLQRVYGWSEDWFKVSKGAE